MNKQFTKELNSEISRYRTALLYFARICDWESFKSRAATLFDYVESTAALLFKKRLYVTIAVILTAVVLGAAFFGVLTSIWALPVAKYKSLVGLILVVGCILGLLIFLEMNLYLSIRKFRLKKRKDRFIKNIENHFRTQLGAGACGAGR